MAEKKDEKEKYIAINVIWHNGKKYKIGAEIELAKAEATLLLKVKAIKEGKK